MRGCVLIREHEQGVGDGGRLGLHVSGGVSGGLGLVRWVLDVQDGAGLGLHPVLRVSEKKRVKRERTESQRRCRGEEKGRRREREREREETHSMTDMTNMPPMAKTMGHCS